MIDPKFYEDRMMSIQRKIWLFGSFAGISVLSIFGLLFSTKFAVFSNGVILTSCFILFVIATFSCIEISYLNEDYDSESEKFLKSVSALGLSHDEYYCRGKLLKPSKVFGKL